MSNKKKIFFLLFLFVIGFCLIPAVAHAGDLFEIQPGDKSKEMFINKLFNTDTVDTLSGSPLNNVVLIFNTCVLMLGGVLAAYTLITGTMSTAHEGEMLGKKWSAMWLPIRTTIGAAFIFPTMGGFCVAQLIVIWLINQGVGLANTLWGAYLDKMPVTSMASTVGPDRSEVFNLSLGILKSQYCSLVMNEYFAKQQSLSSINKDKSYYPEVTFFTDSKQNGGANWLSGRFNELNYFYGYDDSKMNANQKNMLPAYAKFSGAAMDVCGKVTFDFSPDSIANSTGDFNLTSLQNFADAASKSSGFGQTLASESKNVGEKSSAGSSAELNAANMAKVKAVNEMNQVLAKAALDFYKAEDKTKQRAALYDALNKSTKLYIQEAKQASNEFFAKNPKTWSSISSLMKQDGWMYAGSWYIQLYRIQSLMSNVAKEIPVYSQPEGFWKLTRWGDSSEVSGPMKILESNIATFSDSFQMVSTKNILANEYNENRMTEHEDSGMLVKIIPGAEAVKMLLRTVKSAFTSATVSVLETVNDNDNIDDPLGLAYNLGSGLESAIWIVTGILVTGATAFSAIVTVFVTLISPLISLMFVISNMLTVILPFMPFFLWIGAVLGWAMLCIEAVIAAPLWMMIHMHPDGDGVVGRGGAGYGMVLSLTVRPALMIIGLIAALICIGIFSQMVNEMFMTAFYTIASRDGISILQIPVIFGTYAMALFIVIKKSFSLIHVIPDEVLKWLGVNNHNSVEKSSNAGLQSMMAAKMVDEKMGQMNLGNALRAGKDITDTKNKNKDLLDQVDATGQIGSGVQNAEAAAQNPDVAPPSASGKAKGMGDTIADQNKVADGVIDRFKNSPDAAMSQSDKQDLYDAYRVKADNAESLLASGAIQEGSAEYEAIQSVKDNAETAMQGLMEGSEGGIGGSNTGAPNTESSIDAAGATGRPSSSFDGAGDSNNAPDIPQTNVSPEGKIKKDE